jgi:ATP-binding cassette subfamily B protein
MFVMIAITKAIMPKLYASMRQNTESLGKLTGKVSEAFSNVHTIQLMNAVDVLTTRMERENTEIFESNIRTIKLRTLVWPFMIVLIGISQFATLSWGGHLVMNRQLTVGDIMAFNIYIGMLTFPFASLGIILNVYQRAKPASERLDKVLEIPKEQYSTKAIASPRNSAPLLELDQVTFRWPDGRTGLDGISFQVHHGERIGIYGSIGSGKSTLFNVITRLYDPTTGKISLNGRDTLTIPHSEVRKCIGYALQQPLLFSESIKDNLLLGFEDSKPNESRMHLACSQAMIMPDIDVLPNTWDTLIGEKGIKLSGGQKQRLSLARLLMRDAEVIILDDVLSAVDHETEHKLIAHLLETKSALIIASHRPSILVPCDKILVMDQGRVIAQGKYNDVRHLIESKETRGATL